VRFLKVTFILISVACLIFLSAALINVKPTDYEVELEKVQNDLLNEKSVSDGPIGKEKALRLIYLHYLKASLTGNLKDLKEAEIGIDNAIRDVGPSEELYLLRANLNLKLHRLENVKHDLDMLIFMADSPKVKVLRADIDLQEGRYEDAKRGYKVVIKQNRTWDNLARLAYLRSKTGDPLGADRLYQEAEDEISVKEMRSYAWVELQRGLLDLNHGRHDQALAHYKRANKAYSGYWLVEDHMAELFGAQRKFDEAVSLYKKVIARAPRPELQQALGDLYVFTGKPDEAKPWHEQAFAAYLESAQRGEVHYLHHLASFYADVRQDGAAAVKWAHKDLQLRQNVATHDTLAWALYRAGRFTEALDEINKALSLGFKDAHLFFHAAMIHLAAGRAEEGKQFLKKAAEINPRYDSFHVHR
jgi:tetratricopeptide (TPR) repeat protein